MKIQTQETINCLRSNNCLEFSSIEFNKFVEMKAYQDNVSMVDESSINCTLKVPE